MRVRDIIGLVIALVLAIGVAFLTRLFLAKEEKPQHSVEAQRSEIGKILVAKKALHHGDVVTINDLTWQEWPQRALNTTYIKEGSLKIEDLVGSVVKDPLEQGEPVMVTALIKPGDKSILSALVSPGKRAISIDVTAQSASSGLISPGDYVDIIMAKIISPSGGGNQYGQSRTIIRNVKVLAIDVELSDAHEKPKNAPRVATLEVTPPQAELISSSVKEGTLSLSLHSIDVDETPLKSTGEESNVGNEGTVIMMRGKEKSEIQVQ